MCPRAACACDLDLDPALLVQFNFLLWERAEIQSIIVVVILISNDHRVAGQRAMGPALRRRNAPSFWVAAAASFVGGLVAILGSRGPGSGRRRKPPNDDDSSRVYRDIVMLQTRKEGRLVSSCNHSFFAHWFQDTGNTAYTTLGMGSLYIVIIKLGSVQIQGQK
ncbi:uncharacterized protein LOC119297483 [Triticum dicoccoides]|uniref:uncharacterized protein LOC119297483 n=1 Tax=Triticum dicoccoides TaxID=85692 RepID=UPI00188FC974|nr:uncharacterized protein LOC119297483 [Triticum dicoccoides]